MYQFLKGKVQQVNKRVVHRPRGCESINSSKVRYNTIEKLQKSVKINCINSSKVRYNYGNIEEKRINVAGINSSKVRYNC